MLPHLSRKLGVRCRAAPLPFVLATGYGRSCDDRLPDVDRVQAPHAVSGKATAVVGNLCGILVREFASGVLERRAGGASWSTVRRSWTQQLASVRRTVDEGRKHCSWARRVGLSGSTSRRRCSLFGRGERLSEGRSGLLSYGTPATFALPAPLLRRACSPGFRGDVLRRTAGCVGAFLRGALRAGGRFFAMVVWQSLSANAGMQVSVCGVARHCRTAGARKCGRARALQPLRSRRCTHDAALAAGYHRRRPDWTPRWTPHQLVAAFDCFLRLSSLFLDHGPSSSSAHPFASPEVLVSRRTPSPPRRGLRRGRRGSHASTPGHGADSVNNRPER